MAIQVNVNARYGKYVYEAHPIGTSFNHVGGNYIFAYPGTQGWVILYAGQTNDFGARFANHETMPAAKNKGATHILAHTNNNEQARKSEEADIIAWFQPPCNVLLK